MTKLQNSSKVNAGEAVEGSGGDLMLRALESAGVKYVFGIPGTNEVGFMNALVDHPDVKFVLGLHEGPLTAMADGYAKVSGQTAFVLVHTVAGTANGLGQLSNARIDGTPIVFAAGNQDSRLRGRNAFLEWPELEALGRGFAKWSWEVLRADSIPEVVRRAFKVAGAAPRGPVFLTLSKDFWNETKVKSEILPQARFAVDVGNAPDQEGIERAADLLLDAQCPLLLAGEEVSKYGGRSELVQLAELLGAPVVAELVAGHGHINFPNAHLQYLGPFRGQKNCPLDFDVFFNAGGRMFSEYDYDQSPLVPRNIPVIHLSIDPDNVARTYPTDVPLVAHPEKTLRALLARVRQNMTPARLARKKSRSKSVGEIRAKMDAARKKQLKEEWSSEPISVARVASELNEVADAHAIIVTEAITSDNYNADYIEYYRGPNGRTNISTHGGTLGWGIGAACGAKLASPAREVILLSGDGSFQFGIQGLWTAARYEIPVLFIVLNNRSYQSNRLGLVRYAGRAAEAGKFIGSQLTGPEIQHAAIARGYGVDGERITKADDVRKGLDRGLQTVRKGKPYVLDIVIARRFPGAEATWDERFSVAKSG
jgi:benzoylformate decarboxylase